MKIFKNITTLVFISFSLFVYAQQTPAPLQNKIITISGATAHIGNGSVIKNSIITFENGDINRWANLDVGNTKRFTKLDVDDRLYLNRQLQIMMEENEPLVVNFQLDNVNITEKIYYRDSDLLTKLQHIH